MGLSSDINLVNTVKNYQLYTKLKQKFTWVQIALGPITSKASAKSQQIQSFKDKDGHLPGRWYDQKPITQPPTVSGMAWPTLTCEAQ